MLSAQWQHRDFILSMVKRDFRSRYLNSLLGALWAILQPLSQILIYALIFAQVMHSRLEGVTNTYGYTIFLCAALLPWHLFTDTLGRCLGIFVEQGNLLKKLSFPRSTLPTYVLFSTAINFVLAYGIYWIFLIVSGNWPGVAILAVIPLLLIQQMLAMGLGIFLGTLNVFFRDVGHTMGIVLQFWFWLTPIVYPLKAVPERFQWVMVANPMLPVVQAYQGIFLRGEFPAWKTLLPPLCWAILALVLAYLAYSRLGREMVDEL